MKKFAYIFSALILFACNGKDSTVEKPEKLLTEAQMSDMLYDVALLQAMKSYVPSKLSDNEIVPAKYIYEKYKIDSATFAQNNRYYASQMEAYERIQGSVTERLEKEKKAFDEEKASKEKEKKKEKEAKKPMTDTQKDSVKTALTKAINDKKVK